ncbi:MAG: hypothetical protein RBS46_06235 [Methyloversatilis sp.]|nr:hypothetical protein [Methyloversatilis sp.]
MELLATFVDLLLQFDTHLAAVVAQYGASGCASLFCETGLVVTPFMPGDSLLFVAGALAAAGGMQIGLLIMLPMTAAVPGDAANHSVGPWLWPLTGSATHPG